jgi:hypothetical protein
MYAKFCWNCKSMKTFPAHVATFFASRLYSKTFRSCEHRLLPKDKPSYATHGCLLQVEDHDTASSFLSDYEQDLLHSPVTGLFSCYRTLESRGSRIVLHSDGLDSKPHSGCRPSLPFAKYRYVVNVNMKLSLCLTKHYSTKTYWGSGGIPSCTHS